MIKQQNARLKRAAKKTPLVLSAVSGEGVPEALRALFAVIDGARLTENGTQEPAAAWSP